MTVAQSFGITNAAIEQYLINHVAPRNAVLQQMEEEAARDNVPIIGPYEGQFLYVLALGAGAREVLEVGTATGYSGLWLGMAAHARGGRLVSLEQDESRADLAEAFWRQAGMAGTCHVHRGDAFASLTELTEDFDFLFIDILTSLRTPEQAEQLFDLCLARLRPGGLLVADNALRRGDVGDPANTDPGIVAVRRYLERASSHPDLATTVVPLRDGVCISVRQPERGDAD
jgi:predicted O-methyltransferase YrrM